MDYFFSFLFKIILILFGFIVIYKIFLYFVMSKMMKRVTSAPEKEKSRFVQSFSKVLSVYKILFWMAPITLILFPASVYVYLRDSFIYAIGIVGILYIVLLEDYFYRKAIIKTISRKVESEIK